MLSIACIVLYGYALAGYGGYSFGRGRPDYIAWGLSIGTLCGVSALYLWKKWIKETMTDLLIFDIDGVLIKPSNSSSGSGTEQLMTRRHWSELGLPVGIYTGRSRAEALSALRSLNWEDLPQDRMICFDDGILKPSPKGLSILCERAGAENPMFFGDMENDREAWLAFGKGVFVAIGPLLKDALPQNVTIHFDTLEEALGTLLQQK